MKNLAVTLSIITLCILSGKAQIVINEIIPPNTVEIKNLGASTVNIAAYTLCQFPTYNQLSNITQVCGGDLMIEAGSLIAVNVTFNISAADDELALYFMSGSFDNPGNITDYVEWGSTGHVRSTVAVAAGIWTTGDFVPAFTGCASIEYDGSGNASTDWISQDIATSPCLANTLDGCGVSNCSITGAGLGNINCNNNGTPSAPGDDFISFNLNPTGVDLGTTYSVSVSSGNIMPGTASYGSATMFQLQSGSAGSGNVTVTIIDGSDPTCTFMINVTDPGTCSSQCSLNSAGLSGVFCNDSNTPSEPSDDFIMFNLNPTGLNLGPTYNVSVSNGTVTPTSASYGSLTTFDLEAGSAGGGNVTVTITDVNSGGCTIAAIVVDPGSCSSSCELSGAGLADIQCDDAGTTGDGDDFITFTLDPTGANLAGGYSVSVSNGSVNPPSGTYGAPTFFSLNGGSAGAGNVTITITDDGDPACDVTVLLTDPGACSESCNLQSAGLTGVACNNNGTAADPSDDAITFNLNPSGSNLGASYVVSVSTGTVTPTSGTYGSPTAFTLNNGSAGGGNVTVTIIDANDLFCDITVVVTDPGSCSTTCNLINAGLTGVTCQDGGTSSDPGDDIIAFNLNPSGANLGTMYSVGVSSGSVNPTSGTYGVSTAFTLNAGSAGAGNLLVTITDDTDPACQLDVDIVDPGTCSGACVLSDVGLDAVTCNPNGTPDDMDDIIFFSLNPVGSNHSTTYMVSVSNGTVTPDTGTYGAPATFSLNPGSAGAGDVTVTVTDASDPACTASSVIVDPGTCSMVPCDVVACDINTESETSICVDEGGDPDSVLVICQLMPQGEMLAYVVTDTNGIVQSILPFADTVAFTFEGQSSGICLLWQVAWDGTLIGLVVGEDIDTLDGCFDLSNSIAVTKLTGEECISFTFNPELNSLIRLYPVPVSGLLQIDAHDVVIRRVEVLDILGHQVSQLSVLNPSEMDLRNLESGLYYVLLETNLGWSLQKIVVGN